MTKRLRPYGVSVTILSLVLLTAVFGRASYTSLNAAMLAEQVDGAGGRVRFNCSHSSLWKKWIMGCRVQSVLLGRSAVSDRWVTQHLSAMSSVSYLDVSSTGISDHAAAEICNLEALRALDASGTQITNHGASVLMSRTELYTLMLNNTLVDDAAFAESVIPDCMNELQLDNTHISNRSLHAICDGQALRILSLRGTTVSDNGLSILAAMPRLSFLDVRDTAVTDVGIREFLRDGKFVLVNDGGSLINGRRDWDASKRQIRVLW